MVQSKGRNKIAAGAVSFVVQHELWDGNVQDHSDQGVVILVEGQVGGKDTTLLRFNCFDIEKSYVYAPEGESKPFRMDPIVDGNPIGWSIQQIRTKLSQMLETAGYQEIAGKIDSKAIGDALGEVESSAPGNVRHGPEHCEAQPGHGYVRGWEHSVWPGTAPAGRWRRWVWPFTSWPTWQGPRAVHLWRKRSY